MTGRSGRAASAGGARAAGGVNNQARVAEWFGAHVVASAPARPLRLLLEGPPKDGKTVAMRRLVELLRERGVPVSGFVTDEIRERGRRVGFVVRDVAGPEAVLAHEDFQTGVQVGRFSVDVSAFEWVALPALRRAQEARGAVIIDELGRMELASAPFV